MSTPRDRLDAIRARAEAADRSADFFHRQDGGPGAAKIDASLADVPDLVAAVEAVRSKATTEAIAARALGRSGYERGWLDVLALIDLHLTTKEDDR